MTQKYFFYDMTTTGASPSVEGPSGRKTFEASGRTVSGTGAVTVQIRGRNTGNAAWTLLGTISLTLTASGRVNDAVDNFHSDERFAELDAYVTSISGSGAQVTVSMGY